MQRRSTPANLSGGYAESGRLLVASGFWLHTGFVGASILFATLLWLIEGAAMPLPALASAAAGGALAMFAWGRARIVLDRTDTTAAAAPGAVGVGESQVPAPALALGRRAAFAAE